MSARLRRTHKRPVHGRAYFGGAQCTRPASFRRAQFTGGAYFGSAQFTGEADFGDARVASVAESETVWPPGWVARPAKPDNGEDPAFLHLTKVEDGNPPDT